MLIKFELEALLYGRNNYHDHHASGDEDEEYTTSSSRLVNIP